MKIERLLEIVVIASSVLMLVKLSNCQDILFPEDDDSYSHVSGGAPVTERKPLKVDETRCPENMLLYSDEGKKSAWVCDCKPNFVYFPANNTCHEVFQRGPCPAGHYVYLGLNENQPTCVKNPCTQNGYVVFRGACHPLRAKGGPCASDEVLNVNETTYQLECLGADLVPFVIIDAPKRSCPKASRRNSLGICKLVL